MLGKLQIPDQTRLVDAIKEAGNVKRFFPPEFGLDVDRTGIVEPGKSILSGKVGIRRATEAAGIPYTYAVAGYFAGYGLPNIGQLLAPGPPTDEAVVLGDGDTKVVFVDEADIGTYTVLAAGDPRAENKTGKTFRREYVPEEAVLKQIQESRIPLSIILAIGHAGYVRGEQAGFEIDPAMGVDASELYPDVKYTTVDEYLNRFV